MNHNFKRVALVALTMTAALLITAGQSTANAQTAAPTAAPTNATSADPLGGATKFAVADKSTDLNLMLDYTPNTNHLGIYAAAALGYYTDAKLNVTIQQPGDVAVEQIVGTGKAEFGVSYQDQATFALQSGQPIVSLAAIVQHDTSAFATLHDKHPVKIPADLAGLRYGSFGSPIEKPTLDLLTQCPAVGAAANAAPIQYIDVGSAEPFPLMEKDRIDVTWLFYAWDGIRAKQQGLKIDFVFLKDYQQCVPDYYTPLLITNADMIKNHPDVVRAFTQATARGYTYAIQHPDEAAALLLKAVPDLDAALVKESSQWLAAQFQADAPRWGEQKASVWQGYADWLFKHGALDHALDTSSVFSNAFLPGTGAK
jgi:ABC-type nitrate/sulfonate/bicarbonate transport system substrate-binding protein